MQNFQKEYNFENKDMNERQVQETQFLGGANPHLEKSTPSYKLNPHLAPAKPTPSTWTAISRDFIHASNPK